MKCSFAKPICPTALHCVVSIEFTLSTVHNPVASSYVLSVIMIIFILRSLKCDSQKFIWFEVKKYCVDFLEGRANKENFRYDISMTSSFFTYSKMAQNVIKDANKRQIK